MDSIKISWGLLGGICDLDGKRARSDMTLEEFEKSMLIAEELFELRG